MGGGLGFLNKKTWHPGRIQNLELVWKKEQEASKEKSRLDDLKAQIEEERQREELQHIAQASGHVVKSDKLDWMYQGGMLAQQEATQRNEEAMLSGKQVALDAKAQADRVDTATLLPSFYAEDTPASANETWARLHSDPLFAIRQQEQSARKKITSNPVQMEHIRAEVQRLHQSSKTDKKAAKKAKKEEKKAKKEAAKQFLAALGPQAVGQPDWHGQGRAPPSRVPQQQPNGGRRRSRSRSASPPPAKHARTDAGHRHSNGARPADQGGDGRDGRHDRSAVDRNDDGGHGHRENGRQHAHGAERHANVRPAGRREQHEGRPDRHREAERDVRSGRHSGSMTEHAESHRAAEQRTGEDGLRFGLNRHQHAASVDGSSAAEATRQRIEAAAEQRAKEEAEKAAQRYKRTEYKTGRISEEERQRRLAEMTGNAETHDEQRWQRLRTAGERDAAAETGDAGAGTGDSAAFLKTARKTLYGAEGEGATLEDRVGRRRAYNDRSSDTAAFRR